MPRFWRSVVKKRGVGLIVLVGHIVDVSRSRWAEDVEVNDRGVATLTVTDLPSIRASPKKELFGE
jgi:hypothetical protein